MAEADAAPSLPPLREVIARHRLSARRSLGQNFLLDPRLSERIARAAGDLDATSVIEVGPGPGGLTRALLAGPAREVVAIERDARCVEALAGLAAAYPGRLRVLEGDALEIDAAGLVAAPRAIVANLPYNIATPLLFRWLENAAAFASLTLMFQKEVAGRISAAPGGREYGRLSIVAQWLCEVRRLFDVPPGAFVPAPKVTSTLVR
ncbi:MAG: 16S rRNA (adenine(1518)-N(6)/adenine(1519)-N(6))-dimethyltransferase RsmA, partial [Alphaproteobacteria bacterium]